MPFLKLRDPREEIHLENKEFCAKGIFSWRESLWQRQLDVSYCPSIFPFFNYRMLILFGVAERLAKFPLQLRMANELYKQVFKALYRGIFRGREHPTRLFLVCLLRVRAP